MKDLKQLHPKKIIVRMPNWIGDLVMATPVLADLKQKFPEAELTAMCKAPLADLLKYHPYIDALYCFKKGRGVFARRGSSRNIVHKLHAGKYDLGILLTNSLSSAWWFWQGNIQVRIGYKGDCRTSLLTHPVAYRPNKEQEHLVGTYQYLLHPLGIERSTTLPTLVVLDEEIQLAYQRLKRFGIDISKSIVGINPGAAYGSAKCWLPERFEEVIHRLLAMDPDVSVLVFGDLGGASLVKEICQKFPARVINLAGQTNVRELMALIKICSVFLTNDSGPMHIADALGTPLLALFGSTNPIATGPYIQKNIIHKKVACSPCYKRVCPIDFRCMKAIHAQEVHQQLAELLARNIHV